MAKFMKGKVVESTVTGIEPYGIFVSLDEYYSGLIHISEISNDYVRNINSYVNIGETIKVRVLESDDATCHVKLSIKGIDYRINNSTKRKIIETGSGFNILKDNLNQWIEERH